MMTRPLAVQGFSALLLFVLLGCGARLTAQTEWATPQFEEISLNCGINFYASAEMWRRFALGPTAGFAAVSGSADNHVTETQTAGTLCRPFRFVLISKLVGPAGIEPATLGLEIRCSIHLSYGPILQFP